MSTASSNIISLCKHNNGIKKSEKRTVHCEYSPYLVCKPCTGLQEAIIEEFVDHHFKFKRTQLNAVLQAPFILYTFMFCM